MVRPSASTLTDTSDSSFTQSVLKLLDVDINQEVSLCSVSLPETIDITSLAS